MTEYIKTLLGFGIGASPVTVSTPSTDYIKVDANGDILSNMTSIKHNGNNVLDSSSDLSDINNVLTADKTGDQLIYYNDESKFKNKTPCDGHIKIDSFDTNLSANNITIY